MAMGSPDHNAAGMLTIFIFGMRGYGVSLKHKRLPCAAIYVTCFTKMMERGDKIAVRDDAAQLLWKPPVKKENLLS